MPFVRMSVGLGEELTLKRIPDLLKNVNFEIRSLGEEYLLRKKNYYQFLL